MSIMVQSQVKSLLEKIIVSNAHAILLTGPSGVGLATVAKYYTNPVHIVLPKYLTKASTIAQIGIDDVRELYTITRGKHTKLQTVLIDDADMMTLPAQNSLLKLLEEPSQNTRFVLTSHHPELLLATVRSRVQTIAIVPENSLTDSMVHAIATPLRRQQLNFIARGLPAKMHRLIHDEQYFRNMARRAGLAKQLVELPAYQRLVLLQTETLTRSDALELLELIVQFLSITPSHSAIARIRVSLEAYDAIAKGGNVKLWIARAMVQ